MFIAPASYFIEELEEQEKEIFKNRVFQYDNLVCGIVDKIDSKRGYVWATFKVPDNNYVDPGITIAIDFKANWCRFCVVKGGKRFSFYQFLCLKEQDIIDIIKKEQRYGKKEGLQQGAYGSL
jgi:hypothetical protein